MPPAILPPDSSSSSFSSSTPPHRPFSRLPTELVRQIIELAAPICFNSATFTERQSMLRSLCLVSRLFYHLAKPVLRAAVLIITPMDPYVIVLRMSRCDDLRVLVISCSQGGSVDVAHLSGFPNLTSIRLAFVNISSSWLCMLSNVADLQIMKAKFEKNPAEIFDPTTLPNLRALALFNRISLSSFNRLLDRLANQLDAVFLDLTVTDELSPRVLDKIRSKTLFDDWLGNSIGPPWPGCLRMVVSGPAGRRHVPLEDLRLLNSSLRAMDSQLPTLLYLPHIPVADYRSPVQAMEACENISETCEERSIELVFEWEPNDWGLDSGISQDFWRRMKARRVD